MTSTRPATDIRVAGPGDVDAVTALLTEAFLRSPIGDWLIPDLTIRHAVYGRYFRIHAEHGLAHGLVDVTTDGNGVAIWMPYPGEHFAPVDYDARLADACGVWLRRFQLIDAAFDEHHPLVPHHYLAFLGVVPGSQNNGVGTALLEHHHAGLDAAEVPAYLVASTPGSRDLYRRRGYSLDAAAPVYLPEHGPPVWPMWRASGESR